MEDLFWFFILVILIAALTLVIIRYRQVIQKWIKDPKYGSTWYPSRETQLKRDIEDAEAELRWLEENRAE